MAARFPGTVPNVRRLITLLVTLVSAIAAAAPAQAAGPLHPGDLHETTVGFCTLNFVYDGGGSTYFGTADHCIERVGDPVFDSDGDRIGQVAFTGNDDVSETDFAFIRVDAGRLPDVRASVRGHPAYPTGVTSASETSTGDLLQISGHGIGFDLTQPTREQRRAVLTFDDAEVWGAAGPLINGDSGGPIVHIRTGKALGMESRLCIGICTDEGPTVQGIIAKASAAGFPVALRTAP